MIESGRTSDLPAGERRLDERVAVQIRVRLKYPDVETFLERYATNISQGGIFIQTQRTKPPGTLIRFEFQLNDAQPVIRGEGRVTWVVAYDPAHVEKGYGMGVKFTRVDQRSRSLIERVVAEKLRRGQADNPASPPPPEQAQPTPREDVTCDETPVGGQDDVIVELESLWSGTTLPAAKVLAARILGEPGLGGPALARMLDDLEARAPSRPELGPSERPLGEQSPADSRSTEQAKGTLRAQADPAPLDDSGTIGPAALPSDATTSDSGPSPAPNASEGASAFETGRAPLRAGRSAQAASLVRAPQATAEQMETASTRPHELPADSDPGIDAAADIEDDAPPTLPTDEPTEEPIGKPTEEPIEERIDRMLENTASGAFELDLEGFGGSPQTSTGGRPEAQTLESCEKPKRTGAERMPRVAATLGYGLKEREPTVLDDPGAGQVPRPSQPSTAGSWASRQSDDDAFIMDDAPLIEVSEAGHDERTMIGGSGHDFAPPRTWGDDPFGRGPADSTATHSPLHAAGSDSERAEDSMPRSESDDTGLLEIPPDAGALRGMPLLDEPLLDDFELDSRLPAHSRAFGQAEAAPPEDPIVDREGEEAESSAPLGLFEIGDPSLDFAEGDSPATEGHSNRDEAFVFAETVQAPALDDPFVDPTEAHPVLEDDESHMEQSPLADGTALDPIDSLGQPDAHGGSADELKGSAREERKGLFRKLFGTKSS